LDIIIGVILVIVCGYIESKNVKNHNRSFAFISIIALIYALGTNDWTYLLYPFGIILTYNIITFVTLRKHMEKS